MVKERASRHLRWWLGWALAVLLVGATLLLRWGLTPEVGQRPLLILFVLPVLISSYVGGLGPGLLATALSAILGDYFLLAPTPGFGIAQPVDMVDWAALWVAGILISVLNERLRRSQRRLVDSQQAAERAERRAEDESEARVRAEAGVEALRCSEEQFRAFFDGAAVGAGQVDMSGHFVRVNDRYCQITGYSREELLRMTPWDITHPEDREKESGRFERFRRGEVPSYEMEKRYIRKDGRIVWVQLTVGLIRDADGRPVLSAGIVQDITARKQAEEELLRAKQDAETASRAKDHFLAVLSHELRTPLTPVLAAVSILEKSCAEAATGEMLEIIHRNAEIEARLIDDLLDVTRIVRGKLELQKRPADLREILHRAVEVCRPDLEGRGLSFSEDLGPGEACPVEADASRLQQVFWNLVKNAVKFTPHGGCVGIHCRREDDTAVVEVTDSGAGIEPEALGRIFGAFEQAGPSVTRQFGGLGLGLAISKSLVEMHGGTIEAHSEGKGKGATFIVRLPLAQGSGFRVQGSGDSGIPLNPEPRTLNPLRILLVEDHGDTARIMTRLLTADGHQVQTAGDVSTALDLASKGDFDLMISDLGLPDRSGLELMQELQSQGRAIPGIALSGYGQEQDIQRSREAGFAAHLVKPIDPNRLAETIARIKSSA